MLADVVGVAWATKHQKNLQKIYNGKKAALKERHWIPDSDGTYDLERIRLLRPSHIFEVNWDTQIAFWNDPKNRARAAQNKQNRAKSKVMESSATREYPSLIHTFFLTHTVNGVFLNPKDKALYDEMLRLQGLGSNTETGVPYTGDKIMAIVHGGKQRGHIHGVGRLFRSDDKFSQMLTQLESQPEIGGGIRSGGRRDDEDDNEDGEDEDYISLKNQYPGRYVARENPPPWHIFVWLKLCGPDNVARERIPFELFRSTYPGRHVAREKHPQRQVAMDTTDLSLGNIANVVVTYCNGSIHLPRTSSLPNSIFDT
ncbi:hypothetical protein Tco_0835741 [Tanacetum coccineum]